MLVVQIKFVVYLRVDMIHHHPMQSTALNLLLLQQREIHKTLVTLMKNYHMLEPQVIVTEVSPKYE